MDILSILRSKISQDDKITTERKKKLAKDLENLNTTAGESAYEVIRQFREKDPVRKIGGSASIIPYYGIENDEGLNFSICDLPEELLLILEQLVISSQDD